MLELLDGGVLLADCAFACLYLYADFLVLVLYVVLPRLL